METASIAAVDRPSDNISRVKSRQARAFLAQLERGFRPSREQIDAHAQYLGRLEEKDAARQESNPSPPFEAI